MQMTVYRVDDTGINGTMGGLVYLHAPDQLGTERESVAMQIDLPDEFEPWAREDGTAYCNTSSNPNVSGCQMLYDKHTRRVVLKDADGRERYAASVR